jgi:iron(III) transport system substrate-binding protein
MIAHLTRIILPRITAASISKIVMSCLLLIPSLSLFSNTPEELHIISPHRKSVQEALIPAFKEYYKKSFNKDISVHWIDQGGASDDLRLILSRFAKNPNSAEIDLLWGGGEHPHLELDDKKLLIPYKISKELKKDIPQHISGRPLYNNAETWHATALSSFGIFYNKQLLKLMKIQEPKTWEDLADERYFDLISSTDLRRSSSNVTMAMVMLQKLGWEKAFEVIGLMSANTRTFTHSSTEPIKAVTTGEAACSLAVGFYASAKVASLGEENLGFILPANKTIINADPVSILKGAKNKLQAERFIDYILSTDAQKLLILPKGSPFGPKTKTLGRMAVNQKSYTEAYSAKLKVISPDPFLYKDQSFTYNAEEAAKLQFVFIDILSALFIDQHKLLKQAWQAVQKRGKKPADVQELIKAPITKSELEKLVPKWSDPVFRNKTINEWSKNASQKYTQIIKAK